MFCDSEQEDTDLSVFFENITDLGNVKRFLIYKKNNDTHGNCFIRTIDLKVCTNMTHLSNEVNIIGDASEMENMTKLTTINQQSPEFVGDIASFGKMTSLGFFFIDSAGIEGDIEDFVAAQYDNGRTAGTMALRTRTGKIYFEGNPVTTPAGTDRATVTWTDKTHITVTVIPV